MIRITAVQCPVWGLAEPPMGPAHVAGLLKHCNHEGWVFDLNVALWKECGPEDRRFWESGSLALWSDPAWAAERARAWEDRLLRHCDAILSQDPQAVLLWAAEGSLPFALETARRLKARGAKTIFFAGPYFSDEASAQAVLAHAAVDGVMAGPVDDLIPKLAGLYQAAGRWRPMPGFSFKDGAAIASGGRPVSFTFDWDLAPLCDFSGFQSELYLRPLQMPVLAGRGCPWSCSLCARDYWGRYSFKSGDRIFGEVAENARRQPFWRHAEFYDLDAGANAAGLRRFSEMTIEHGLARAGLTWSFMAAPRPELDEATLDLFRRAGCREIIWREPRAGRTVFAEVTTLDAPLAHRAPEGAPVSGEVEWSAIFGQGRAGRLGRRVGEPAAISAV